MNCEQNVACVCARCVYFCVHIERDYILVATAEVTKNVVRGLGIIVMSFPQVSMWYCIITKKKLN